MAAAVALPPLWSRCCCRSSREFAPYHPLGGVSPVVIEIVKTRRESPVSLLLHCDGRQSRPTSRRPGASQDSGHKDRRQNPGPNERHSLRIRHFESARQRS